jgi:mannose-1-phosphate guanylyltransferase/mannose-6-phosphate isomerase
MHPKQFLSLTEKDSLLQATLKRAASLPGCRQPFLVSNEGHRFLVAEQARAADVPAAEIILEPLARNTAPAICAAALRIFARDEDALMLVMPSDQIIRGQAALEKAVAVAAEAARAGKLATFGIKPGFAATGYGYIKALPEDSGLAVARVERFVEKPDATRAQGFLDQGGYYWNSGIFLFSAAVFLDEMARHAPAMLAAVQSAVDEGRADLDFFRLGKDAFGSCPADSIDYAIMEHTERAVVVPLDLVWSDVGSWDAVWDVCDKDGQGNATWGDAVLLDSENCLVHSGSRMVATVGVKDLVVVETADAVLVTTRQQSQGVKKLVEQLRADLRQEPMHHRLVFRPWGSFDSVESGDRFQVKRITVKPGARLSLQMHHHRAEHWIVVSGTAKIRNGDEEYLLTENESTYIPIGKLHSLENPGRIPLELIEVQSGPYLGEDDIVRFEDLYGRT